MSWSRRASIKYGLKGSGRVVSSHSGLTVPWQTIFSPRDNDNIRCPSEMIGGKVLGRESENFACLKLLDLS